jgi:hypothetical protein
MSTIRAGNTNTTALVYTGDITGDLVLEAETGVVKVNTTGGLTLPSGTTAQRPQSPQNGYIRVNTTTNYIELYYNGSWRNVLNATNVGPNWSTGVSANIGSVVEDLTLASPLTVAATDIDGDAVTYSVAAGSLLPTGLSLNSSTGAITGTPNLNDPQNYSANGYTHTFTLNASDSSGNTTPKLFNIVRFWRDGLTAARANTSAKAIKDSTGITADGTYWIQPTGCPEPFQVHCYMSIEGGGWMLTLRFESDFTNGGYASGSFLVANWAGWGYNTKTQIDALGYNYSVANDNNCFSPVYAYSPFNDVMVIANRSGQQAKRVGWRHNATFAKMYDAISTSTEKVANSVLFGNAYNWLSTLDVRSDTNLGAASNTRVGFKIRSDTGSTATASNWTGGFWTTSMHYGSQIGCGRENQDGNVFGGGIGGYYNGARWHRCNGHWWNHGDGRNSSAWSSSDTSTAFYGHAVYVREL